MGIALSLHVLSAIAWVGGMFFAWMILRPAAAALEPPARLALWLAVFQRFFPWVWAAIAVLFGSGLWIVLAVLGGFAGAAVHIHLMLTLALVMTAIYAVVYFHYYRRLGAAVGASDWPAGAAALGGIRRLVGINLLLGALTAVVGAGGGYLLG